MLAFMLTLTLSANVLANDLASGSSRMTTPGHNEGISFSDTSQSLLASIHPEVANPGQYINQILSSVINPYINENLNSLAHVVDIGHLSHAIDIQLASHELAVTSNQTLTQAEAIAVNQVLSLQHQSLVLNNFGQAIGGSLNANSLPNSTVSLLLPSGVTLIDNSDKLVLNGNLANYGDIIFAGTGNIQANMILNDGLISAPSNLGLDTGVLINNGGIYAVQNININAPIIFNSQTIESANGNVNIFNTGSIDITGTSNSILEAVNGSININETSEAINQGINLAYQNYLSQELNLNTPNGYVQGATDNVSGIININANLAHLATASSDMLLGNDVVKGDPTYVNTGGSISLNGAVSTSGANLAIIASNSIIVNVGSSGSITTGGGNLTMIAGLGSNISSTGNTNSSTIPNGATAAINSVTVTLGASSGNSGGNIDLVTNNTLASGSAVINTSNTTGNGGNVTLLAIASGSTGGEILTSNSSTSYSINATSTDAATGISGGTILILADASPSTATNTIVLGNIETNGGVGTTASAGSVNIYTQNAVSNSVVLSNAGSITTGYITNNGSNIANADIVTVAAITASATVATGSSRAAAVATRSTNSTAGGDVTACSCDRNTTS